MSLFIAQSSDASPEKILSLSIAVNAALRGETTNTGAVSVSAGQTSVTVQNRQCRYGRLAELVPTNAAAARTRPYLSNMTKNEMTFSFETPPVATATFGWVILGDGGQR